MVHFRAGLATALVLLSGRTAHTADAEDTTSFPSLFSTDGPVESLTRKSFISSILESRSPGVVWFYSEKECPQCGEIAEMYEAAAKKMTAWGLTMGAVNVDNEPKLAKEVGAPKFPPMMNVYHGRSAPNPYGGLPVRPHQPIALAKDSRSLMKQVLNLVPDHVVTVNLKESGVPLKEALSSGDTPYTAVLITATGKTSPLLRVLASELAGDVDAIQAHVPDKVDGDDNEEETLRLAALQRERERVIRVLDDALGLKGGVRSMPSLVVMDKANRKSALYEGDISSAKEMLEFIRDTASLSEPDDTTDESSSDAADPGFGNLGGVLSLDPDRLSMLEEEGIEALVVAFVATFEGKDSLENAIPGWEKATKSLQGQIRAGVFDCGLYPSEPHCTAKKPPLIKVYPHGEGLEGGTRAHPSVFQASQIGEAVAEAEASLPEVVTIIPAGTGVQKTEEVMQGVVATSILGEGNPMVLIVLSKREEPNLVVKTIAAQFQGAGVKTLFISQPDPKVTASLQLSKLPAMILMFQAPDDAPELEGRPVNPTEKAMMTAPYNPAQWGPPTHKSVSEFVLSNLSHTSKGMFISALNSMSKTAALNGETLPSQLNRLISKLNEPVEGTATSSSTGRGSTKDDPEAPGTPFPGVAEVTAESWAALTGIASDGGEGVPRIVGVFLMDRFAQGFDGALKSAESAAESAHATRAGGRFVWVDAPCQESFAKALGVSDLSALPLLAVFSPKHQKLARFVGAWESDSMSSFLRQALAGREPMFPVGDEPRLENIDCSQRSGPESVGGGEGDGAGEEDDDLGDLMAEILEDEARAKRELEEEVARGLDEIREADKSAAADDALPKKKTKTVKRRKKKSSPGSASGEL